jgi:WhiB family redox-sensing transcriptional regulator
MSRLFGAKCIGRTDEMFPHQTRGKAKEMSHEKVVAALAICDGCPAIEPCADGAIRRREQYGIWGGLTPERIDIIAESRAHYRALENASE